VKDKIDCVQAYSVSTPTKMPIALCLPLNELVWKTPSPNVRNNILRSAKTLSDLCGDPTIIQNTVSFATKHTPMSQAVANGSVLWLLVDSEGDDTKVLALAMVNLISNLTNICVLPEHRGKGFAKMLLNHISEEYKKTNVLIFSPVAPHAVGIFTAMGWTAPYPDEPNTDGTIDMTPHWCLQIYRERFENRDTTSRICPEEIFSRFQMGMLGRNLSTFAYLSKPLRGV